MRSEVVAKLMQEKLIVIIRVEKTEDIYPIVKCMDDAGVKAVEVTSNTPGYEDAVTQLRRLYPNMLIGAGTVIDTSIAKAAIEAGAQFLVTPNTCADVVKYAHQYQVPVVMGALTPTDIVGATKAKADVIKLFPAGSMGSGYLKSLVSGPFIGTPFFPVGGIDEYNFSEWMANGASGIGIGGHLAVPVHNDEEAQALTTKVRSIVSQLNVA